MTQKPYPKPLYPQYFTKTKNSRVKVHLGQYAASNNGLFYKLQRKGIGHQATDNFLVSCPKEKGFSLSFSLADEGHFVSYKLSKKLLENSSLLIYL